MRDEENGTITLWVNIFRLAFKRYIIECMVTLKVVYSWETWSIFVCNTFHKKIKRPSIIVII